VTDGPVTVVLGAGGFIGRHVCLALAQQGATVYGLGHGDWAADERSRWGLTRWIEADVGLDALSALLGDRPLTALIHCAGGSAVARSYAEPLVDFRRSVDSTAEVLEFARTRPGPTPRVVLTSSAAVYGDQGDVDITEASACSPISPYGFHKLAAEQLCTSYARFFNVPVTVVRLFSVYGEGLRKQLLWEACQRFQRGEAQFFGTGHELRDWIHVADAAALLCAAASAPQARFGLYNGGHEQASTHDLLSALGGLFDGHPVPVFTGTTHTGNPRRLTADCAHARHQLGWRPLMTLADGLRRYADWFKSAPSS
jgi:UDP-glucose 4-epimerase